MKLIVGHTNMDMDCLSSMALAKLLYPDHQMVKSRFVHPVARDFCNLYDSYFDFLNVKDIKNAVVEDLVVVDTRSVKRIDEYLKVIDGMPERITVYDHHPSDLDDLDAQVVHYNDFGSNTTILALEIMEKGIKISPDVATIALTGIFADTGNFTHDNVRVEDFKVAHHLMYCGADINIVRRYLKTLKEEYQMSLFHDILNHQISKYINGHLILFSYIELEKQVSGLAAVAEKVFEVENPDAYFSVFSFKKTSSSIIIGRSQKEAINLNQLLGELGGGGHAMAASVLFKDKSGEGVLDYLVEHLEINMKHAVTVGTIMTKDVYSVGEDWSLIDTSIFLESINHSGAPVNNQENEISGFITLKDIMKARKAKQMHAPVKGYMIKNVIKGSSDLPIRDIERLMFGNNIGHIPIVEDGKTIGLVTRTDYLNFIKVNNQSDNLINPVALQTS
ncbi:MAG: CBS domain-containing protein [Spirochaetia bacterium]|jgi:tRNA nucleotidyltransferase (CCA-adding enzyme)|nr:CBS domain-containing protein [Spirochaetia bacterium]